MVEIWNQTADFEEGDLTDFDSTTPTWDGAVNAVADFDSETDVDGDLNDAANAAHDGATGIEITFDDANAAYGTINASAVNQTSGVIPFWFNKNDVAVEAGKIIELVEVYDGAGQRILIIRYMANGDIFVYTLNDSLGYHVIATGVIDAGWHKIDIHFKVSTGVGNNDGYTRLYLDNVFIDADTGLDNDTIDWDYIQVGMCATNSTTFSGTYWFDTIKIDPVGAPMADKLAAQNGSYGMSIPIMDSTSRYVSFTDPTAETRVTCECNFDLNSLTMANGDSFQIMTNSVDLVYLAKDAGGYYLRLLKGLDAGNTWGTQGAYITDANHYIRLVSAFSTGAGNDDGYYKIYVDDVLYTSETGLDNDTKTAETVYFGAIGTGAGTYGIIHFDDGKWADEAYLINQGGFIMLGTNF